MLTTSSKYEIIHEAVTKENSLLTVEKLCEYAQVSRSGYYAWVKSADKRAEREEQDRQDFDLILKAYKFRGYAKGIREIHMTLLHMGIRMNIKKIRRLMNKYGLKCPHRGPNPYRQMAKAIKTNSTFPNIVDRKFTDGGVRKILLTDITYIFYKGGVCYLSTVLDAYTREVLAYQLSRNLMVGFVLDTIDELIRKHGSELDDTAIIHSDQGCHYTSKTFIEKLKDNGFVQSMSRRGNCWDNAPQESFFGHMKDEIKYEIALMDSFEKVSAKIDDWIDYYNNDRYQTGLAQLSPSEYYKYVTTGVYPLQV